MPTQPSVRDDFRCGLCRQKNAFHCEHDTPYRDQYFDTYDQQRVSVTTTKIETTTNHHSKRSSNSTANQGGVHLANTNRSQTNSQATKNPTERAKQTSTPVPKKSSKDPENKGKSSCVIL